MISRVAVVLFAFVVWGVPSAASAAVPGGRIAYTAVSPDSGEWQVRVVNPDGTGARTVYSCPTSSCELMMSYQAWDPAGQRVAVAEWTRVPCEYPPPEPPHPEQYGCVSTPVNWRVIDVDRGTVQTLSPPGPIFAKYWARLGIPFWSPDGKWFAATGSHEDPAHPGSQIDDVYVVASDGTGQKAIYPNVYAVATGWSLDDKAIVFDGTGTLRKIDPVTGAVSLLSPGLLGYSFTTNPSPDGRYILSAGLGLVDNSNLAVSYLDGSQNVYAVGGTWSPDSSEIAYTEGEEFAQNGVTSLPGPTPLLARAPTPHSPVRTVIAGERIVGNVSWSPPPDPAVKIDTPIAGQEITGHESTPAAKDAVQLTGSVSSHTALTGWCYAIQAPKAAVPATPSKSSCNRPFDSSSPPPSPGGRITARFKTDLGTLVGKDLQTGENTVWVWGYGASSNPDVAKVMVEVLPNFYIKHIEVAQAISPDLGALAARDPLLPNPDTFQFDPLSAHGFSLPLVAGKSTLLRIYVGDAGLSAGQIERQPIHFRVFDENDGSIIYEANEPVDVTAPDVAPAQATERAALNFWLPPEAAKSGEFHSFKVDINTNETGAVQQECGGCFPNGNEAAVQGISFKDGGGVVIAPVPIYEITPDSRTVLQPDEADFRGAVKGAIPMLPIPDRGVTFAPQPGPGLLIDQKDKKFTWSGACELLLAKLEEYRAMPGITGPVGGFGATRWVGYAPPITAPDGTRVCAGKGELPGRNLVLLGPTPETFAHEFGHTLGLTHATGLNPAIVPAGATPLGYPGIGGVGYGQILGQITEVFDKAKTGDLMSYDRPSWTSPKTWNVMYEKILAESGAIRPQADVARAQIAANRLIARRLVTGIVQGTHTTILDSLVTQATSPASFGPTTARVVARDDRGNTLAQTPIRGTLVYEHGESRPALPFVVALPDNKKIASLEVLPAGKGKPLARLRRSKHPPTGKLVGLPSRATATRSLTLRWRATDRDRGDRLSVALVARRGTAKFRTLMLGPATGRMVLDPGTLGKGNKLSVRLLISDGLTTTVVNARPIKLGGRR